jgi:hypothetical protein
MAGSATGMVATKGGVSKEYVYDAVFAPEAKLRRKSMIDLLEMLYVATSFEDTTQR